ncbi:hypothetical protein ACFQRL_09090 [Microbacterium fluvii]|uniref:Uncharacterized protein n=1 Tax=Microbacterium fluvii TaxID=415215 RepID=A0ABW2HHY5_9MICO|nr:hypothetical protein [Microbacterium fluvii]MCU4672743.1 hypothetical protein [Microbacterium fluvii]
MDTTTIGFVTTGVTLFVTVALFAVDYIRRWAADARKQREQIVRSVLDTVDRATRSAARAPLSDLWAPSGLEYALLIPRLYAQLPAKDHAIATWVARQVQIQQLNADRKAVTRHGLLIATELVKWSHRERKREWFAEENRRDPWVTEPPSLQASARRYARSAWDWARLGVLVTALGIVAKRALSALD